MEWISWFYFTLLQISNYVVADLQKISFIVWNNVCLNSHVENFLISFEFQFLEIFFSIHQEIPQVLEFRGLNNISLFHGLPTASLPLSCTMIL